MHATIATLHDISFYGAMQFLLITLIFNIYLLNHDCYAYNETYYYRNNHNQINQLF